MCRPTEVIQIAANASFEAATIRPSAFRRTPMDDQQRISTPTRSTGRLPLVVGVWLSALGLGLASMMSYDYTPTAAAAVTSIDWRADVPIARAADRSTLVVVLHPLCPCSKATVAELERLLARSSERVRTYAIFSLPDGLDGDGLHDPRRSSLWASASLIPGVTNVLDLDGKIAARFDAQSSGQTYVYDAAGHLRFSGGITAGRGLVGDNEATVAVETLISANKLTAVGNPTIAPVFGCSIR